MVDGVLLHGGRLGEDVTSDEAAEAADASSAAGALGLATRRSAGSDAFVGSPRSRVYIATTPDFVEHPQVANGASELLAAVLGEAMASTRAPPSGWPRCRWVRSRRGAVTAEVDDG